MFSNKYCKQYCMITGWRARASPGMFARFRFYTVLHKHFDFIEFGMLLNILRISGIDICKGGFDQVYNNWGKSFCIIIARAAKWRKQEITNRTENLSVVTEDGISEITLTSKCTISASCISPLVFCNAQHQPKFCVICRFRFRCKWSEHTRHTFEFCSGVWSGPWSGVWTGVLRREDQWSVEWSVDQMIALDVFYVHN